ncbi:MAG TPA: aquaporin [Longimicrobiales bacterium]|nr:aquaporin [Longimicrobiales bacterium]
MEQSRTRIALAEFIGTFALIFVGVLAISAAPYVDAPTSLVNLSSIAFAHGLTIAVMIAALAAVSGAHFNPAITMGFVATGRMPLGMAIVYWLAQLAGATVAAFILLWILGGELVALGTPAPGLGVGAWSAIVLEGIATFFLVFVVFGTAVDERAPRAVFPLAIGLTITVAIMAIGPMTGGAVNPARAFGPALASGNWFGQGIYWIGPLIGGALGGLVQHHFLMSRAPTELVAERGGPAPGEERGEEPPTEERKGRAA